MHSNNLYGIERPGCLFNYNIEMIVKGESVTNIPRLCNARHQTRAQTERTRGPRVAYVQFVHAFDAGHYIRIC